MSEYQRTLYGPNLIPLQKMSVRERTEAALAVLGSSVDSAQRTLWSWMMDPHVNAFILSIPNITNADVAREEYLRHLEDKPGVFETEARSTRRAKQSEESGETKISSTRVKQLAKKNEAPAWYKRYLKTQHWLGPGYGIRPGALMYYGSCVLCGMNRDLQVHHKHYNSLGKEDMHDICILCEDHHKRITPMVSIYVPRVIPPAAIAVFKKEGIDVSEFV